MRVMRAAVPRSAAMVAGAGMIIGLDALALSPAVMQTMTSKLSARIDGLANEIHDRAP